MFQMCMMQAGALTPAQSIILIVLAVSVCLLSWHTFTNGDIDNAQP